MWTAKNRARYNRDTLRYPSDVTEEEWAAIAPLIPPARRGGCKRTVNIREVFNGVLYLLSTGCQWRGMAPDFPPRSTNFCELGPAAGGGGPRRDHSERFGTSGAQAGGHPPPSAA